MFYMTFNVVREFQDLNGGPFRCFRGNLVGGLGHRMWAISEVPFEREVEPRPEEPAGAPG